MNCLIIWKNWKKYRASLLGVLMTVEDLQHKATLNYIKFIFETSGLFFFQFSMFHSADTAWINLVIFYFGNYAFFTSSLGLLSGLQEDFHDPMKLTQNPLYNSRDAAQWENKSVLLVLDVCMVIYVFMCDVLWSKNTWALLRRNVFPKFPLNWRFIQTFKLVSGSWSVWKSLQTLIE